MKYSGLNSPMGNKGANPATATRKAGLKGKYAKGLAQTGVKPPKSPLA